MSIVSSSLLQSGLTVTERIKDPLALFIILTRTCQSAFFSSLWFVFFILSLVLAATNREKGTKERSATQTKEKSRQKNLRRFKFSKVV